MDRYTMKAGPTNLTLAAAVAQRSPIFIYCEERAVHLAVSGADVIETLCVQRIRELGCKQPRFRHLTAVERLPTWRTSLFPLPDGTCMSGDILLRDASEKIAQLLEHTKEGQGYPLYWTLQDIISGNQCRGLNNPLKMDGNLKGWFELWKRYKFLFLAVGQIDQQLIAADPANGFFGVVAKAAVNSKAFSWLFFRNSVDEIPGARGGVLINNELLRTLVISASQVYSVKFMKSSVCFDGNPGAPAFEVVNSDIKSDDSEEVGVECESCVELERRSSFKHCVHYFL
jgi:hypothetical protein